MEIEFNLNLIIEIVFLFFEILKFEIQVDSISNFISRCYFLIVEI